MKNKIVILIGSIISLFFLMLLAINTNNFIKEYDYNYNIIVNNLVSEIKKKYP